MLKYFKLSHQSNSQIKYMYGIADEPASKPEKLSLFCHSISKRFAVEIVLIELYIRQSKRVFGVLYLIILTVSLSLVCNVSIWKNVSANFKRILLFVFFEMN